MEFLNAVGGWFAANWASIQHVADAAKNVIVDVVALGWSLYAVLRRFVPAKADQMEALVFGDEYYDATWADDEPAPKKRGKK